MVNLFRRHHWALGSLVLLLVAGWFVLGHPLDASAAACTQPSTDYGNVSNLSVTLPASTTYRVWTRMAAPDTSNNTYLLQIDGTSCYTVGGSSVPTYASGATTYFANNSSNWISKTSSGTQIDVSLSSGAHTLKLIGNANGVVVDRIILTQDTSCIPTGTGDNCANPPDTTPPAVSITSPANNSTISTTTTVTASATDDVAVSKVEFYVDGALKGTDTSSPYTYSLDPSTYSAGSSHYVVAKAYDSSNNSASSSQVNFTIADTTAPTVSLTAPASGATISGTTTLSATASDNVGVTKVEFYVDGGSTPVGTDTTSPYSISYSTTGLSNSSHTFTAKAYDAAGNSKASTVSATVSNSTCGNDTTAPSVSVTAPTAGATISGGSYTVTANASDSCGVKQVQFFVDGTLKSTDTTAPYSFSLDTTTLGNGAHTFTAKATDNSTNQNVGTSSPVSATVNNGTYLPEDINQDGHVNILDFHLLVVDFGKTGSNLGRADINGDGQVNILDFHLLVTKFGT